MYYEKIMLSEKYPDAFLTTYVSKNLGDMTHPPRRAVLVCPGGGYRFLSAREAEPIVKVFWNAGCNVFLLNYSIAPKASDYAPLIEASLAIKHIRENAQSYNIDPDYVFVIGFSAGGHLAASTGILYDRPQVVAALGDAPEGINRPTGMLLSYPVITGGIYAHRGSINNVSGRITTPEDADEFSLELYVNEKTSPAFIWHTFTDKTVPVQNSLLLAEAMTKHNVPFELHIFPEGVHGLSLANEETYTGGSHQIVPHVQCWAELAVKWVMDFNVKK